VRRLVVGEAPPAATVGSKSAEGPC
jgi:hypothetical protein